MGAKEMDVWQRIFGKPEELPAGETFLIVGLGNPGRKHRDNRHNLGFMVLDRLAQVHRVRLGRVQQRAFTADFRLGPHKIVLAKPQTYMNLSGDSVGPLLNYYKLDPEQLLVIYDELDLELGVVRLREKGSAGGHNGMKSIIRRLGSEFPRLRLGIGRPPGKMPVPAYVLQDFGADEVPVVREMLETAVQAVEMFAQEDIVRAMSRYNGRVGQP